MSATPEMIAAAWAAWHSRHGGKLGPGPAFVEAINAAMAVCPGRLAGIREAAEVAKKLTTIGGPSLDYAQGYAAAQKRIAGDLLALAEGKEG